MRKIIFTTVVALLSTVAFAGTCDTTITGDDAMNFNIKNISVPQSCKNFTVNFKHIGKMAKKAMGHNWVLVETKDVNAVAADGVKAGLENDYIKKGDSRIIASTKMIGSGEQTSVSFDVSKLAAGKTYAFFCTFPGHSGLMRGTLTLK